MFTPAELLRIRNALDMHPLPPDFAPSEGQTMEDAVANERTANDAISARITAILEGR